MPESENPCRMVVLPHRYSEEEIYRINTELQRILNEQLLEEEVSRHLDEVLEALEQTKISRKNQLTPNINRVEIIE